MTANEFREAVFQLVASPVDGLSFEDKAAIVRHAVTPRPITVPSSAKIQAHGYVLLCVLILLMVVGGVTATVWLNWGVPLPYAALGSLWALLIICAVVILGSWLRDRNSSGCVLLDLGPNPVRGWSRKVAWSVSVFTVPIVITKGWRAPTWVIIFCALLGLCAFFFFLIGNGRLQVRANGLWQCFGLLRWEKIGSWRWEDDSALWVKMKGFTSWCPRVMPMAPGQRQEVHELLLKYCSDAAPPSEALQPTEAAHDGFSKSKSLGSGLGG